MNETCKHMYKWPLTVGSQEAAWLNSSSSMEHDKSSGAQPLLKDITDEELL